MFERVPSTYANIAIRSEAFNKRVDQRCLADTCFASDENRLAFAEQHFVETCSQLRQRVMSSNNFRCCVCAEGRSLYHRNLPQFTCYLTDKAIAATVYGLDEARGFGIIVECFTDLTNGDFEHSVADKRLGPGCVQELLFRYELLRTSDDTVEHRESLGSEFYRLRASQKTLVRQVKAKGIENDALVVFHGGPETLPELYGRFMTYNTRLPYSPLLMERWQYNAGFVVQFREDTDVEAGRLEGKVEHIASHEAIRFHSIEELLGFIASVLARVRNIEEL